MRKVLSSLAVCFCLLALAVAPLFGQANGATTPVVGNKYMYTGVTRTGTGNIWSTARSSLNYSNAVIYWVSSGAGGGCTLKPLTGPTAALATLAVDDPNSSITCTSSGQKVVSGLNGYINVDVYALAAGSVTVYVTLTNFAGNALNQTLSTVVEGNQGTIGQSWFTTPGNGTTSFKDVAAGVAAQGAGVQQFATVGKLSSAVASNTTAQVVAAPGASVATVILGVWLEKATNTSGYVNIITGTGTNCGSNTATVAALGPSTASSPLTLGFYPLGAIMTNNYEVCLQTDAATTSARALTQ